MKFAEPINGYLIVQTNAIRSRILSAHGNSRWKWLGSLALQGEFCAGVHHRMSQFYARVGQYSAYNIQHLVVSCWRKSDTTHPDVYEVLKLHINEHTSSCMRTCIRVLKFCHARNCCDAYYWGWIYGRPTWSMIIFLLNFTSLTI